MDKTKGDQPTVQVNQPIATGGLGKWFTLTICSLLVMINYMDRQVLSVVLQPMKVDLGITDMQAGMFQTVFTAGLALLALPVGWLVDKWSRSKAIGLMAIFWSISTFLTGLGKNFIGVLIPRAMVGIGEAGFSPGGVALLTASFPSNFRSRALGIFNMALPVGVIAGTILGGYLSAKFGGWRTPFYWFAVPGIILGILAFLMKDYKNVQGPSITGKGLWQNIAYVFKIPTLKWSFLGLGLLNFFSGAFLAWAPALFMRTMNITEDKAGLVMALVMLASFLGAPAGGWLSDLLSRKNGKSKILIALWVGPLSAILFIPGILLLSAGQFVAGIVLVFLFTFVAIAYLPGMMVVSQEVVHPRAKGLAWGTTLLIQYLIASPAPALVGLLSDSLGGGAKGLEYACLMPAAAGILAALFFWLSSKHYNSDRDKAQNMAT